MARSKAPAKPQLANVEGLPYEPVEMVTTGGAVADRVPIFSIDGVAYTIPAKPRPALALRFLHNRRTVGEDDATDILLEELLGPDGYKALREYDELTTEQLKSVFTIAQKVALGALEEAMAGNS